MKKTPAFFKVISFVLAATLLLLAPSCAKKMVFARSGVVPAAVGSVKVKKDKNNNHTIQVSVSNLAPASQLSPPREAYVVWMVTESNGTKNIGQFTSSSGLLSKALKASLKTVTSFKPKSFFITAEDDGTVQYPVHPMVLTTN